MPLELHENQGRVSLDTIRRLYRRNARLTLYKLIHKTHPAELACVYRYLNSAERQDIFKYVQRMEGLPLFLQELDHALIPEIFENYSALETASIISVMPTEELAELLDSFPEENADDIKALLNSKEQAELSEVLQYADDSAGRIMSHEYMAFHASLTVAQAIEKFQLMGEDVEMPFYIYVVNQDEVMVGVLSLRQLLLNKPDLLLSEIMEKDFIYVTPREDQEVVAELVTQYNYLALPVLEKDRKLVGIITVDDVIDVIREEATEDMMKMAGAGEDEDILLKTTLQNAGTRFPWLMASWIGGVVALGIIGAFESLLNQTVALAAFIPVIMGMGGNVGTQTSTIIVRGIATGHVNLEEVSKVILKEIRVGMLLGIIYGLLLGILVGFQFIEFHSPVKLSLIVGLSIFSSMSLACLVASVIPIFLEKINFDPAISTGPFVTTAIDIIGVTLYFFIAGSFLSL
ncbi:MAG: magnesium transporter [Candidatus Marinimicrobia bacterium]|nr:magnesium transporter [Candidatus Neomarinimicrobiota bacterium]